jgi:hypothetical protein
MEGKSSAHKAKGRTPFRGLAPGYPIFRRPGSAPKSQLLVTSEVFETYELSPRFSYPVLPFAVRAFLSHSRHPVSRVLRESRFGVPCGLPLRALAGLVSGALPSSVAGPLPNLVPDSHPEFLPRFPCGSRFRFSWENLSRRSCKLRFRFSVALVYSLLLEDCSSVELKDTLDCPENKGV